MTNAIKIIELVQKFISPTKYYNERHTSDISCILFVFVPSYIHNLIIN